MIETKHEGGVTDNSMGPSVARTCFVALALLAALFASGLFASRSAAAQPLCLSQPERSFRIEVELNLPKPEIDRSLSRQQLAQRMGKTGSQVHGLHSHGTGLRYSLSHAALPKEGGYCFWLETVLVEVTYASPTIFVAKDHRPGGCNDQAILAHETEHERVARRTMESFKPRLSSAIARAGSPQPSAPIWTQDHEASAQRELARVGELLAPEMEEMRELMIERQKRVDSPNNYRLTQNRCPDW